MLGAARANEAAKRKTAMTLPQVSFDPDSFPRAQNEVLAVPGRLLIAPKWPAPAWLASASGLARLPQVRPLPRLAQPLARLAAVRPLPPLPNEVAQ